jgi:WD40 repeat protein
LSVIFISHSSRNSEQAIGVRDWLRAHGWHDTFLDLDAERGLAPGQRWQEELKKAGERCSAVIVLLSCDWVESKWCQVEFLLASQLGKRIFGVIVAPTPLASIPTELSAHYQIVDISDRATADEGFERLRWGLKRAGLDPLDFQWPPADEPSRSPYRGLLSLEEKDAGVFFGRDAAITRGLDILRRARDGAPERLVVVLGASGAGKSSFLKAGLLARLRRDEQQFFVLPTVRPGRAAVTGPEGLLRALSQRATPTRDTLESSLRDLRKPVVARLERFASAARDIYRGKPPTLVLPIDQAEELFASDSSENPDFFDLIRLVLDVDDNVVAVLTIRSDSYGNLQAEPRLIDVPRLPFDLLPLSLGAYKQVIEGPGRLAQPIIVFEPALTDRLVADLERADALPLLAFTLQRLVEEYGAGGTVGLAAYEERLGGLRGAVAKAIEAAFGRAMADESLPSDRVTLESLARRAFIPWLVKVDNVESSPKRRVAVLGELPPDTRRIVRHFVDERILVSGTHGEEGTIEVSHESVLRHWKGLSRWIDEERGSLLALDAARSAAYEWNRYLAAHENGTGEEWLVHRGERLAQAEALLLREDYVRLLSTDDRAYLNACRRRELEARAHSEEQLRRDHQQVARQQRLQRRVMAALGLVVVVTITFGSYAVVQSRVASRELSGVLAHYAQQAISDGQFERATRIALLAAREGPMTNADPAASGVLAAAASRASLVLTLPRLDRATFCMECSNGERALSLGADGAARVWDLTTGREVARQAHRGAVRGAVFARDGQRVLSWSDDGILLVWEATTGKEVARHVHQAVWGADFTPDGKRVLSWGADGTAQVWDATSGKEVVRRTHERGVRGALFAPNGRRVLSWGADGSTQVWDAESGREIARQTHEHEIAGAVFAPDGQRVLSWDDDGTAWVWNASTSQEVARQSDGLDVRGAVFSPDSRWVLTWRSYESALRVWDLTTGQEVAWLTHGGEVRGALFTADGGRVLTWDDGGTVRVWDAAERFEIAHQAHKGGVSGAVFSHDGRRVLSWGGDGVARVWDATTGEEVARQAHENAVRGAIFVSDGQRVLSWDDNQMARVWNAKNQETARKEHDREVRGAALAPDAKRVLSWGDRTALVWDATTARDVVRQIHKGRISGAAFAGDGQRVLSWDDDGTALVWSATTGQEIARQSHQGRVLGAAFAADGRRALSWGDDGTARVWNATTGAEIARQKHDRGIRGAVFAPDGQWVLSWGNDGTARVWEATTGHEVARKSHDRQVRGAVFAPDRTRVLSWDIGGRALLWDTATGREIARQGNDDRDVRGSLFAADGQRVLSWSRDGTSWVWNATSGQEVARHAVEYSPARVSSAPRGAVFAPDGRRVLSWGSESAWVWDATSGRELAHQTEGGSVGAVFATDGQRVLSSGEDGTARLWDATSGQEVSRLTHSDHGFVDAAFSVDGDRVLSWSTVDLTARVWDVSWSIPRNSNRALSAEVCDRVLRGAETSLQSSFINGRGETIRHESIRRITPSDARVAPLLRDRVGEDACRYSSWLGWFDTLSELQQRLTR